MKNLIASILVMIGMFCLKVTIIRVCLSVVCAILGWPEQGFILCCMWALLSEFLYPWCYKAVQFWLKCLVTEEI